MARSDDGFGTAGGVRPARFRRRAVAVAALLGALWAGAAPGAAQVRAGGHGLYHHRLVGGGFGYGARVEFDLGFLVEYLAIGGTYDRISRDCVGCRQWDAGGRVGLHAGIVTLGMGAFFSRFEQTGAGGSVSIEDDWIFAVLTGLRYPIKGFLTPFFELHVEVGNRLNGRQTLSLGVLLGPHGDGDQSRNRRTRATR